MSIEIALIAGSSIAGAISASFMDKLSRVRDSNKKQERSSSTARSELLSLLFEKNLAAAAITRVYEAFQDGSIDRLERDRLLLKYKHQLDSLNQKITYLKPIADLAELTELRNNLVLILQDRISVLDKKLQELSKFHVSQDEPDSKVKKILSETLEVQTSHIKQNTFNTDEKSIEQLHNEIIQALKHLEQIELDKE